jgi:acyl-CoA thioester hydrolase
MLPFYTRDVRRPFPESVSGESVSAQTPLPFRIQQRVRWSDCDPLGIIWYGSYLKYFEAAEHEMMRAAGFPYEALRVERKIQLPRKAFQVEFHSPATMDELLDIEVGFARFGTTSLTMRFEAYNAADRTHRASATLTVVCVLKATLGKQAIPEWLKDAFRPYLIAE